MGDDIGAQPVRGWGPGRLLVVLLLAGLALLGVASGRAALSCRREVSAAEAFLAQGDLPSAILAARHAAEWYLPLDSCSERGLDLLDRVVKRADAAGQSEIALFALRSARTSVMLTRGLTVPHAERLPALHTEIARRMVAQRQASGQATPGDEARYRAQLDGYEARRPNPLLGLAGSLTFLAWLAAIVGFAWNGFDANGRVRSPVALRWGLAAGALLAVWLVLVRYA